MSKLLDKIGNKAGNESIAHYEHAKKVECEFEEEAKLGK